MGLLDKLQKRLESMADDAGKSVKAAVTPKAPFPLSISGVSGAASKKLDTTLTSAGETAEKTARSKATKLQDNTIGKVTTAVNTRVDNEVSAVEKKVNDKVSVADKAVDDKIDAVGKRVDGGIDSANKSLDKALGRKTAKDADEAKAAEQAAQKDEEPAAETVAEAEAKDGGTTAVPLATGWKAGSPKTRARSNAVIGVDRKPAAAVAEPDAAEAKVDDAEAAEPEAAEPAAAEPTAAEPTADTAGTEAKVDENSDEAIAADAAVDVEGQAIAAARARKRAADAEAEEEDLDLAALFGDNEDDAAGAETDEKNDDTDEDDADLDPDAEGPDGAEDLKDADGDTDEVPSDAEIDKLAEGEKDDSDKKKEAREKFKQEIKKINFEEKQTLSGLAVKAGSTKNPWVAYFLAVTKFKKKLAVRKLKDELDGKKTDETEPENAEGQEETAAEDDKTPVEEPSGPENQDETEVELTGGLLRRGTASSSQGEVIDTTDPEHGPPGGRQIFVADQSHKLFIAYRQIKDDDRTALLGADKIAVGGRIRVEAGKIDYMDNNESGEGESKEAFIALLRALSETGGVSMGFDVFEAEGKEETTAQKLIEAADKAAPEPEQVDLLAAMKKDDAWKAIAADFSEALITQVAEKQGWKVAGAQIVDATGPLDPESARTVLQKAASKSLVEEAAAKVKAKKGEPTTVDA